MSATSKTDTMKIGVIAPGYQVCKVLDQALCHFRPQTLDQLHEILVIDNHSTDGTFERLRELQSQDSLLAQRLSVIHNQRNLGLGGSLKLGLQHMLSKGFTHFIIIHCDDQGNNDDIVSRLLEKAKQEPELDLILASRFIKTADISDYNKARIYGNLFFNLLTYLFTGVKMSDAGTGIMLCKTQVIAPLSFPGLNSGMYFNPQLNVLMLRDKGIKYGEIPLHWKDATVASQMKALYYTTGLLKSLSRYGFSRFYSPGSFGGAHPASWMEDYPHTYYPAKSIQH